MVKECTQAAHDAGIMSAEEMEQINEKFERALKKNKGLDAFQAKKDIATALSKNAIEMDRVGLIAAAVHKSHRKNIANIRDARGRHAPVNYVTQILHSEGGYKFNDVVGLQKAILAEYHTELAEFLQKYRDGIFYGPHRRSANEEIKAELEDILAATFGEQSDNPFAQEVAKAWGELSERLRQRFNKAGGHIGKLEWVKRGLPQVHDREAIQAVGKQPWIDATMKTLDRKKMRNHALNTEMDDHELTVFLGSVWEEIVAPGHAEAIGSVPGIAALRNRHADPRTLHFDGSKGYLAYKEQFGHGDTYETMAHHLWEMSRDISTLEVLGPNPARMYKLIQEEVGKIYDGRKLQKFTRATEMEDIGETITRVLDGKQRPTVKKASLRLVKAHQAADKVRKAVRPGRGPTPQQKARLAELHTEINEAEAALKSKLPANQEGFQLEADLDEQLGRLQGFKDTPFFKDKKHINGRMNFGKALYNVVTESADELGNPSMAKWGANIRGIITGASLGSAAISAFSDHGFAMITRSVNGMPVMEHVTDFAHALNKGNRSDAVAAGMINDRAQRVFQTKERMSMAESAKGFGTFTADRVISGTGLGAVTQAGKNAFGWGFYRHMARESVGDWGNVSDAWKNMLGRHNISEAEFNRIKTVPKYGEDQGTAFIRPNEIRAMGKGKDEATKRAWEDLADKYSIAMFRERAFAVPEASAKTAVVTSGMGAAPGTLVGEISRSLFLFQSFGISVLWMHGMRTMQQFQAFGPAAGTKYLSGLIVLTSILGGAAVQTREILSGREPVDMKGRFVGRAIAQGGGFGMIGDVIQSWGENRYGQGLGTTMMGPVMGRADRIWSASQDAFQKGKIAPLAEQGVRLIPGSNAWFARFGVEEGVIRNLNNLLDPDAEKKRKRKAKSRKKKFGNEPFFK